MRFTHFTLGFCLGITILAACGMGAKRYNRPPRALTKKLFVACKEHWISRKPSTGEFCNRTCKKWYMDKKRGCREWNPTIVKNMANKADYTWAQNANMILINFNQVFK